MVAEMVSAEGTVVGVAVFSGREMVSGFTGGLTSH